MKQVDYSPEPESFCPSDDGNPCFPATAKH